ncbi:MAG: hypothetical protein RBT33_03990 [Candidatus Dojkabacteria bacterium]|jgi:hypothetical protein|nr:hypothetical protein [Candidatus Dojkabacteria bacterium]
MEKKENKLKWEDVESAIDNLRKEDLKIWISDLLYLPEELDKAREEGRKGGSKKLYRSISKELYKLYSDIECLGDLRDGVYDLSDKYEKLSKLKNNK